MPQIQPPSKRDWLPYAGFLLAVGGIVYQGGAMSAQLASTTERVVQLEVRDREKMAKLEEISTRGERSAMKLDFLVQAAHATDKREGR